MGPSYSSRALIETILGFTPVSPIISHTNFKIMPLKNKRFLWMFFVSLEYTNQAIFISCINIYSVPWWVLETDFVIACYMGCHWGAVGARKEIIA